MNTFTAIDKIYFNVIVLLVLGIVFWGLGWVTWNEGKYRNILKKEEKARIKSMSDDPHP